ncbi:TPA: reverse transcriptase, partial [Acinetobacter baumannii]
NEKYNWYIPPHVIENVKYNLLHLTNIQNNLKMKLNFSKTISRMEQIISGYQHCYSDADSLNLKDFNKILILEKQKAINLLFKNLGIDISTVHSQYLKYLLDN